MKPERFVFLLQKAFNNDKKADWKVSYAGSGFYECKPVPAGKKPSRERGIMYSTVQVMLIINRIQEKVSKRIIAEEAAKKKKRKKAA